MIDTDEISTSENSMVIALMVQDLLHLEILPSYDCRVQNPPF